MCWLQIAWMVFVHRRCSVTQSSSYCFALAQTKTDLLWRSSRKLRRTNGAHNSTPHPRGDELWFRLMKLWSVLLKLWEVLGRAFLRKMWLMKSFICPLSAEKDIGIFINASYTWRQRNIISPFSAGWRSECICICRNVVKHSHTHTHEYAQRSWNSVMEKSILVSCYFRTSAPQPSDTTGLWPHGIHFSRPQRSQMGFGPFQCEKFSRMFGQATSCERKLWRFKCFFFTSVGQFLAQWSSVALCGCRSNVEPLTTEANQKGEGQRWKALRQMHRRNA